MKVFYCGGKQAGAIGLLTLLAGGHEVEVMVSDGIVERIANLFALGIRNDYSKADLLVSVHWRRIIPMSVIALYRLGGINVHPCLYKYKGADPVNRMLKDGCTKASVGAHRLTEVIDSGEVLDEIFVDITGLKTAEEVYNLLYPYYSIVLSNTLRRITS